MERDFDKNPYSADETRVAKWLVEKTGISGGDDPIGFILASHAQLVYEREQLKIAALHAVDYLDSDFFPHESAGHIDRRKAADGLKQALFVLPK